MNLLPLLSRGAVALLALPLLGLAQGSLAPTTVPAPTMRTLDQLGTQLDDVQRRAETRIVLSTDTTPGDDSCTYLITRPGSYLLGDSVLVRSERNGIVIASSDVTLDLNGYSIEGGAGSFMGIFINATGLSPRERITIRNGMIRNMGGSGIEAATGVNCALFADLQIVNVSQGIVLAAGSDHVAQRVQVRKSNAPGLCLAETSSTAADCLVQSLGGASANGANYFGIRAGLVRHCVVADVGVESGMIGIRAGIAQSCAVNSIVPGAGASSATGIEASTVRDCTVTGIGDDTAIIITGITAKNAYDCRVATLKGTRDLVGISSTEVVRGCSVQGLTGSAEGFQCYGIIGGTVTDSQVLEVRSNASETWGIWASQVSGCRVDTVGITASSGSVSGIGLRAGGVAAGNSISAVRSYGIRLTNAGCMVAGNSIYNCNAAGIWSYNDQARIENNLVASTTTIAAYGYWIQGGSSLVVGNRATGPYNTAAFSIASANRFGPIVTTALPSGEITATNPWANFAN
ncbi:MAG: hypothetical protein IPL39_19655 [Opitutaceae bacterium]|nr:hypothetical protein [Opitutaceae bacterium]